MQKVTVIENRFEADLVEDALNREEIAFVIRTFHDTAYDGLFETQKGYAVLLVEEPDEARARLIVDDVRAAVAAGQAEDEVSSEEGIDDGEEDEPSEEIDEDPEADVPDNEEEDR